MAQRRAAQHRLQAVDEHLVAAPVDAQRVAGIGGAGGPQIGVDVAAAETVDGLLGIADQDQRRMLAERAFEHLPLDGVGVLKLIDQHDPPAPTHPVTGRRVLSLKGFREPGQQVVVAEDA